MIIKAYQAVSGNLLWTDQVYVLAETPDEALKKFAKAYQDNGEEVPSVGMRDIRIIYKPTNHESKR